MILVWTTIIGEVYTTVHVVIAAFISSYVPMGVSHLINAVSSPLGLVSAILAAIAIFYPLSGLFCSRCLVLEIQDHYC